MLLEAILHASCDFHTAQARHVRPACIAGIFALPLPQATGIAGSLAMEGPNE
jgi:hypothetical protein